MSEVGHSLEEAPAGEAELGETAGTSSDKMLIISIIILIAVSAAFFAYVRFTKERPRTIEEMHVLNLQGKLKPLEGYVYKGVYSFVNVSGQWYTQLKSPKGTKIYDLAMRYSPKDLEDVVIEGSLDTNLFDNRSEFYVTFNPIGNDFTYMVLAVADFDTHLAKVFEKRPISACDRNETGACATRPVVTCDDSDKLVLYIKQSKKLRAYYNNNCIVVEGEKLDLVKGVDRILYNLYGMMEQEEMVG